MHAPSTYLRLIGAGYVLVREGVISMLPPEELPPPARFLQKVAKPFARRKARNAERSDRLSRAVERLGPSWVKLGQFLATRPDVVGAEIAADLAALQDRMAMFPEAEARKEIEDSLGRPIEDLFTRFDAPIAAASIAQVHPAEVMTEAGRKKVAVKVIRPGVRKRFRKDLDTFYLVAEMQERYVPATRRLRPVEVTRTLEQTTKVEMDLRLEAAALSEMAENTKDDPGFRVPAVDWERTGRDCVTMEWIDGI